MPNLKNQIDFSVIFAVHGANPNGDPNNDNMPRMDNHGIGEVSNFCIKNKIRNRMEALGHEAFVLPQREYNNNPKLLTDRLKKLPYVKNENELKNAVCGTWMDVRTFGLKFSFDTLGYPNIGISGPVTLNLASSVDPIEVKTVQISCPRTESRGRDLKRQHFVRFGLYQFCGSINERKANVTGFSAEDAEVFKECLRTLFVNDESSSRPAGTMNVVSVFWWEHNSESDQYTSRQVFDLVKIAHRDGIEKPACIEDYNITVDSLPGLKCEVLKGF